MNPSVKKFDLLIIGAGAAGLLAAIAAARRRPELSIAIVDRTFAAGRKILITGAGRCNLANAKLANRPEQYYYGGRELIKSVFGQFGYSDIIDFFNDLGIATYQEKKNDSGKIYPVTDSAKTVVELLIDETKRLGVKFFLQTEIRRIKKEKTDFVLTAAAGNLQERFFAKKIILAAGGKTYPALGANGSGYQLAADLGHKINPVFVAGVPLLAKNSLSQILQKTKLNLEVQSVINGKKVKRVIGDIMFTDYGLSGTASLELSREISEALQRKQSTKISVVLNFFPGQTLAQALADLQARWQRRPEQTLEKSLFGFWPPKLPAALLKVLKFDQYLPVKDLSLAQQKLLAEKLTAYEISVTGTRGWNEAEFCAGGVAASEINQKSLESMKVPGLYLAGEIVDVDGQLGGYNLAWAWASGYVAGQLQ